MRNLYLDTLGLAEGATKRDIKTAFRKLSKQYHPDISTHEDAKERFIEISEAYSFLMKVGPRPQTIQPTEPDFGYDVQADIYAQRRRQAQEYAQRRTIDAIRRKKESIKYLLRFFNIITVAALVFNLSLEIDRYLPLQKSEERIIPSSDNFTHGSYDIVQFETHTLRFMAKEIKNIKQYHSGTIYSSMIYNIPRYVELKASGMSNTFPSKYSALGFFSFLIKLIFLCAILYRFVFNTLDAQLTIAIFMMFIYLFQLYIFSLG
ncbi:MAG: DnaJ domain-containing protein [Reichenbachiella sp.]